MANADHIPTCDFVPNEAQEGMDGAPARPGRIGEEGTNTSELTHEFISNYLPNRKYVKDCLSPKVILKFADELQYEINTKDPTMRVRPSKR